jgi:hypothetical protein
VEQLLPPALPLLLAGLKDRDDSVQAAAAEALVPLAPLLLRAGHPQVAGLRATLWQLLADMEEELSVATSSSLTLLAALYSAPAVVAPDAALAACVPTLWPFLSHSLGSARLAAATCLARLAAAGQAAGAAGGANGTEAAGAWLQPVVGPCLRLLLQCLVLERAPQVQRTLLQAWQALLQNAAPGDIAIGLSPRDLRAMLTLLCTPCGQPLDAAALVVPLQGRLVAWSSSEAAELVVRPSKRPKPAAPQDGLRAAAGGSGPLLPDAGAGGTAVDPEAWPGMADQQGAVQARLLASRALAELCDALTGQVRATEEAGQRVASFPVTGLRVPRERPVLI